jgi:hypothetical protein
METLIILLALATVVVPALTEFAAARSLEGGEQPPDTTAIY